MSIRFLCCINDLAKSVTFTCIMYVDDTTLRFICDSLAETQDKVETDIETDLTSISD